MNADSVAGFGRPRIGPAVGERLPLLVRDVTQSMIDAYAEASGDFNPIHVDPDYSRTGPFGRTIAHGLMTLAFVGQVLNDWSDGAFDAEGEVDSAFTAPVFAGDRVEVTGEVDEITERHGAPAVRVRLVCTAGGRQILAGYAYRPIKSGKN